MSQHKNLALNAERIAQSIVWLRGHKVLLDAELARLYGVETRALVQAVKRNRGRFPEDFMFQLTWEEAQNVILNNSTSRSQNVILKRGTNIKYRPYAFTEQGVAMLSSVLKSPRAIAVNVEIMRAFVRLREWLSSNKELAHKLVELERRLGAHDQAIGSILSAIRELMTPLEPPKKRRIGFIQDD
ncbi:MAG: ORF6N domain-containing protein [Sulfuricaulis sp.]